MTLPGVGQHHPIAGETGVFRVQAPPGWIPLRLGAVVGTALGGSAEGRLLEVQDLALLLLVLFPADQAPSMQVCQLFELANRVDDQ